MSSKNLLIYLSTGPQGSRKTFKNPDTGDKFSNQSDVKSFVQSKFPYVSFSKNSTKKVDLIVIPDDSSGPSDSALKYGKPHKSLSEFMTGKINTNKSENKNKNNIQFSFQQSSQKKQTPFPQTQTQTQIQQKLTQKQKPSSFNIKFVTHEFSEDDDQKVDYKYVPLPGHDIAGLDIDDDSHGWKNVPNSLMNIGFAGWSLRALDKMFVQGAFLIGWKTKIDKKLWTDPEINFLEQISRNKVLVFISSIMKKTNSVYVFVMNSTKSMKALLKVSEMYDQNKFSVYAQYKNLGFNDLRISEYYQRMADSNFLQNKQEFIKNNTTITDTKQKSSDQIMLDSIKFIGTQSGWFLFGGEWKQFTSEDPEQEFLVQALENCKIK